MIPGMHVTIHTSANMDKDARLLLSALGIRKLISSPPFPPLFDSSPNPYLGECMCVGLIRVFSTAFYGKIRD